jgi:hypothetical protein
MSFGNGFYYATKRRHFRRGFRLVCFRARRITRNINCYDCRKFPGRRSFSHGTLREIYRRPQ